MNIRSWACSLFSLCPPPPSPKANSPRTWKEVR